MNKRSTNNRKTKNSTGDYLLKNSSMAYKILKTHTIFLVLFYVSLFGLTSHFTEQREYIW